MLLDVPSSLAGLLSLFAGCFTAPTFETFCALSVGMISRVGSRTVTGMLQACGLSSVWHHSRAHRFFSRARWCPDRVGLVMLELILTRLADASEPVVVAVDETLLKRFGPRVFARQAHFDSSALGRQVAYGNSWVMAGVLVKLPFLERAVCLPVLFRLHRPGHGPTPPELARELIWLIAGRLAGRELIVLGDGGYANRALAPSALPADVRLILRTTRRARLTAPAPPRRPGQLGRRRLKGPDLPALATLATEDRSWQRVPVSRYGQHTTVEVISQRGLWWRRWRETPVRTIAIRDRDAPSQIHSVLITNDLTLPLAQILELYAKRWAIEILIRDAKQLLGVGDPENRTPKAVERTTPFAFLCLTLTIIWYALHGHQPDVVEAHRRRSPWYLTKHQPSFQDMLIKLRRAIIATRISNHQAPNSNAPKPPDPYELLDLLTA